VCAGNVEFKVSSHATYIPYYVDYTWNVWVCDPVGGGDAIVASTANVLRLIRESKGKLKD